MKCDPMDRAFPTVDEANGLTKREYFAAQIITGMCSNPAYNTEEMRLEFVKSGLTLEKLSVKMADFLIAELNK
jgi:hypothetical protein